MNKFLIDTLFHFRKWSNKNQHQQHPPFWSPITWGLVKSFCFNTITSGCLSYLGLKPSLFCCWAPTSGRRAAIYLNRSWILKPDLALTYLKSIWFCSASLCPYSGLTSLLSISTLLAKIAMMISSLWWWSRTSSTHFCTLSKLERLETS